jgi:hypothetical protein
MVSTSPIEYQDLDTMQWIQNELNKSGNHKIALNQSHCYPCHLPTDKE